MEPGAAELYRQAVWERFYAPWLGPRPPEPGTDMQRWLIQRRRDVLCGLEGVRCGRTGNTGRDR